MADAFASYSLDPIEQRNIVLPFESNLNTITDMHVHFSIFVGVTALASMFRKALSKQLYFGTCGAPLYDAATGALKCYQRPGNE